MNNTLKRSKLHPIADYIIEANTGVTIALPNGADLTISTSEDGKSTSVSIDSHNQDLNPSLDLFNTGERDFDTFRVNEISTSATNKAGERLNMALRSFISKYPKGSK